MWQNLSEICVSGSEDLRTKAVDFRAKSAKHATFLTALTQPADTAMHCAASLESRRKGTWKARHAPTCLRAVLLRNASKEDFGMANSNARPITMGCIP